MLSALLALTRCQAELMAELDCLEDEMAAAPAQSGAVPSYLQEPDLPDLPNAPAAALDELPAMRS
jgi:hypothetical protein